MMKGKCNARGEGLALQGGNLCDEGSALLLKETATDAVAMTAKAECSTKLEIGAVAPTLGNAESERATAMKTKEKLTPTLEIGVVAPSPGKRDSQDVGLEALVFQGAFLPGAFFLVLL